MEAIILRGIVSSIHPDLLKATLLGRYFSSMDRSAVKDCNDLFKLFIEWILDSEDKPELIRHGHEQLVELAKANAAVFRDFVNPNFIIDIFSNSMHSNKAEVAPLIGEILDLLRAEAAASGEENTAQVRSVTNVAKAHLVHFLRLYGVHLDVASSIGKLYSSQPPTLLPSSPDWSKMASTVIQLLSNYKCEDGNSETGLVSASFVEKADNVSEILRLIWGQSQTAESLFCINETLAQFYNYISSSNDKFSKPSCALLSYVDKVPSAMMEQALQSLMDPRGGTMPDEGRIVTCITTIMEWLTQRPSTLLSGWLLHALIGLHKSNRHSVLIEITHGTIVPLLHTLPIPELQETVESLFFHLLLGFQHSEAAFNRLIQALPAVLTQLEKNIENSLCSGDRSKIILDRLVEATFLMLNIFPNVPDLYVKVQEKLKELKIPPPDEQRMDDLKTLAWLSRSDSPNQMNPPEKPISISTLPPTLDRRSETRMVGLVNLGNTCYMNSVIQALYITRTFRDMILAAPVTSTQPVLIKLQQTFAFLRYTLRAIYSPSELLKSARPPWFESGRQQDCSEFLRFLLDTIQEQEKMGRKGLTTFREHRVIEPPSTSKPAAASTVADETLPMEVKSSCSISAFESISETLDTSNDVDMLSQGSGVCGDEDFMFGSRTSLSKNKLDFESDEDIAGSRNSLDGLKRWTTEENLSFGDPRGSTTELMDDGQLHDSHSNSTDSGIQSVGDSIRGSSDSMSNGGGGQNQEAAAAANQQTAQTAISANCVDPTKKLEPQSKVSLLLPTGIRPRPQQPPQQQQQPQQSPNSNSPFVSLVQKVFGGKLQTTYECCNCKSISLHKECFTDLHLAFPDKEAAVETRTSERQAAKKAEAEVVVAENISEKAEPLTMQKMVTSCLKSEVLQGDNQYHCDHCGNLQDAVKTMKIIEGPEYLMTTLMRFQYDRVQNRKTKVFTDIKYELNLTLPTYGHLGKDFVVADEDDEDGDTTIVEDDVNEVIVDEIDAKNVQYSLYAIVVHSGYSSDGGHYYTYAREPMAYNDTDVEAHNKNSTWYIFNDSKVSFSTFDSFVNISKKLPRDTAYLLFYQKVKQPQEPPQPQIVSLSSEMRTELKKSVEHDNASFSREKERSSTSVYNDYSSNSQSSSMSYRKGDKDDDGLGGGGRGNCGGGDFNTPGRFVC